MADGTEERMRDRRHRKLDIDATIREGIEQAFDEVLGKEESDEVERQGDQQEGRLLLNDGRIEPEPEERDDEPAGAETELDGEEEEGSIDEDDGSVEEPEDEEAEESEEDDHGLQDDEEGEIEEDEEEGWEEGEVDLAPGPIQPPDFWPDEVKQEFSKMPPKAQEFYYNSHRQMQADYTGKMQGISEIHKAIDPVREDLARTGVSEGEMIRRFVAVHKRLEDDPKAAVAWIANLYGVTLDDALHDGGDSEVTPKVKEIDERLSRQEMEAAVERAKAINNQVEQLKADGKMPLYAEAEPVMMRLVQQIKASGQELPSIMDLYDHAVWTTPTLREKALAQRASGAKATNIEEKKKNVAKSKRAAGKTKVVKKTPPRKRRPLTLSEELSRRYDEAMRSRGR